jgi:hypothetical protein
VNEWEVFDVGSTVRVADLRGHSALCLRIRIDIKKTGDIQWQPQSGRGGCRRLVVGG